MLKIGNVSWRGRCKKHPTYNPSEDGEGGIRGGCPKCYALLAIHHQHRDLMKSIREFGPVVERRKKPEARLEDRQTFLFDLES